jgi:hypothetical protein
MRRFPAPSTVEKIPGGLKVLDANGESHRHQSIAIEPKMKLGA